MIALVAVAWVTLVVCLLAHEIGHWSAARRLGIGVRRVAVGVGPVLLRLPLRGDPLELRLVPVGAAVVFCAPVQTLPGWHRLMLAAAGPAASVATGVIALWAAYLVIGQGEAALAAAAGAVVDITHGIWIQGWRMIEPLSVVPPAPAGPAMTWPAGSALVPSCLALIGIVSTSIGVFNLLPVPPLDGAAMLAGIASAIGGQQAADRITDGLFVLGVAAVVLVVVAGM